MTTDPAYYNLIHFVPQQGNLKARENTHLSVERNERHRGTQSGKEVKEFYESLIEEASCSQSNDCSSSNNRETRKNRICGRKLRNKEKQHLKIRKLDIKPNNNSSDSVHNSRHGRSEPSLHNAQCDRLYHKLLYKAQVGDSEELLRLLEFGLDINYKDFYGWTPLMCAAKDGHSDVVRTCLEYGADRTICNSVGQTAEQLARDSGFYKISQTISNFSHNSAEPEVTSSSRSTEKYWCEVCKMEFSMDEQSSHKRSTVHLFNSGQKPAPPAYLIPESNRGFQMLLRTGWEVDRGLGPKGDGVKYPVRTVLKADRSGLGRDTRSHKKAKVTHFNPNDLHAIKGYHNKTERRISARKAAQQALKVKGRRDKMWEQNIRYQLNG